jgi:putative flavoprotein involved in K+ transport
MTMGEVAKFVTHFAARIAAPIRTQTAVTSVQPAGDGYHVTTNSGEIRCQCLILASGACNLPNVPSIREGVPSTVACFTPMYYRRPDQLPEGGVLVVGASATGVQLAEEIHRSGRSVTLSVGEHVRLPRTYRGRDILWWMNASGVWDERYDQMDDLNRARGLPSPQLVGKPDHTTLDLNVLGELGVKLVGRWSAVRDGKALFSGGLRNQFTLADLKMNRLLDTFDAWARQNGGEHDITPPERFEPTRVPDTRLDLDLKSGEIRSVVWATGFRPDYSWLHAPVFDHKGRLRHDGGVVDAPGLYVIGLPVLRRRKSSFICGAEDDARDLISHLAAHLESSSSRLPSLSSSHHSGSDEAPQPL